MVCESNKSASPSWGSPLGDWASDGSWCHEPTWTGTKEARAGSHRDGAADPSDPVDIYPQALLCRGAFFIPRVRALPGRESRMPAEVAAIRPAVAGTRGMNPSWGGKDRRASARPISRSASLIHSQCRATDVDHSQRWRLARDCTMPALNRPGARPLRSP